MLGSRLASAEKVSELDTQLMYNCKAVDMSDLADLYSEIASWHSAGSAYVFRARKGVEAKERNIAALSLRLVMLPAVLERLR
jgi:hypothetical protein